MLAIGVEFCYIHREGNAVADLLEKEALSLRITRTKDIVDWFAELKRMVFSNNSEIPYLRIPK